MEEPTTDNPLTLEEIEYLESKEILEKVERAKTRALFRESVHWKSWIEKLAVGLGSLFLLAGVMFFFAANWKGMSPMTRLFSLQGGVALLALLGVWCGVRKPSGQYLLLGSSVLVGVLMAVFGQVYQTGADAFENFALWAALIFIWVLISKFLPLWMLWIVVMETAIVLFGGQVLVPDKTFTWDVVLTGVGVFTLAILAVWEWFHPKANFAWLRKDWFRPVMVAAALIWLTMIPFRWIFEFSSWRQIENGAQILGTLVWLIAIGGLYVFYTKRRPSVLNAGLGLIAAAFIFVLVIARQFDDAYDSAAIWLVLALLTLGSFGGVTAWLIRLNRNFKTDDSSLS